MLVLYQIQGDVVNGSKHKKIHCYYRGKSDHTSLSRDSLRLQLPADSLCSSKHKVRINAFLRNQFLMPVLLDDFPVIHHQYLVGIPHGL